MFETMTIGMIEKNITWGNTTDLRNLIASIVKHGVIAGGYAKWAVDEKGNTYKAGDIDIWPLDGSPENYGIIKDVIESKFRMEMFFESDMSVNYKIPSEYDLSCSRLQIIKPRPEFAYKELCMLFDTFDLSIVKVALLLNPNDNEVQAYASASTFENIRSRMCMLDSIRNPISAMIRIQKYQMQGYFLPVMELLKILVHIDNNIDQLKNIIDISKANKKYGGTEDMYREMCKL
jgi:hypothetical protein